MPDLHHGNVEYSDWTGIVFLFNLIVGTGALALPAAFQKAGWAVAVILLLVLSFFSFVTVTFVVESLAVANAVSKRNEEQIEETPLVSHADGQETNIFEITEKHEIGEMGVLMTPKWCQVIICICLCVYLFGDMSIYAVLIGATALHIVCDNPKNFGIGDANNDLCFKTHTLTRLNVYRLSVIGFICVVGPLLFFNLQKTKHLQIFTAILRWLAFFVMLSWSLKKLILEGKQDNPPSIDIEAIPTLFGTVVYSFMCQHSIPGLVHPIQRKDEIKKIICIDFVLIVIFYLLLSLTAIFTFSEVADIYILNFWSEVSTPKASVFYKILSYYLAMFPIFTLSASFPIIGHTLKNNLRVMILRHAPFNWYYDKLLIPLITIAAPTTIALAVSDIQLLVGVIGSYAGTCVQYLIPCLLVVYARTQAKYFNTVNKHESPFKSNFWLYLVYLWMIVSLILISINYSHNLTIPLQ